MADAAILGREGIEQLERIAGVKRGVSIVDEYENISPLERAVEYIMLGMRTTHGISERDYRIRCQYNWKPIASALEDEYEVEVPYMQLNKCKTFLDAAKFVDDALSM